MLHRHKKTGHLYRVIANATDCTNSRDSSAVVVYSRNGSSDVFVRDAAEFREKFEPVDSEAIIAEVRFALEMLDRLSVSIFSAEQFAECRDRLRALLPEGR